MEFSFLGSSLTFSGTLQHFLSFRNLVLDDKSHNKSIFCYVSVVLYCFPPASPPPIHPDSSLPGPPCSLTTASTSTSTSLRAIRLCLYQLIYYCCFLLALPSLLICPLFTSPHPASRAASVPVSTGSQQQSGGEGRGKVGLAAGVEEGRGRVIAPRRPLPPYRPDWLARTAAVRGEPVTKWSIYLLNEKIAFFDC